jgi:hypothetical protein
MAHACAASHRVGQLMYWCLIPLGVLLLLYVPLFWWMDHTVP